MKTRQDHARAIGERIKENGDAAKAVHDYAREEFARARKEDGFDTDKAKELLKDILLGAENALREAGMETKLILVEIIDAFVFVFGDILEQTWEALTSYAKSLRELIEKAGDLAKKGEKALEKLIREHDEKHN